MEQGHAPDTWVRGNSTDHAEEADAATAAVGDHGVVTSWSAGARTLLGYEPEDIVGRPAEVLLDATISSEDLQEIRALPRWAGHLTLRHRDGRSVVAYVLAHRRTAAPTPPEWFFVAAHPTGEVNEDDDALALWGFEQSPCCSLSVYDTHLRMRRSNTYSTDAVGLPEAGIRGLRISRILANPMRASVCSCSTTPTTAWGAAWT